MFINSPRRLTSPELGDWKVNNFHISESIEKFIEKFSDSNCNGTKNFFEISSKGDVLRAPLSLKPITRNQYLEAEGKMVKKFARTILVHPIKAYLSPRKWTNLGWLGGQRNIPFLQRRKYRVAGCRYVPNFFPLRSTFYASIFPADRPFRWGKDFRGPIKPGR